MHLFLRHRRGTGAAPAVVRASASVVVSRHHFLALESNGASATPFMLPEKPTHHPSFYCKSLRNVLILSKIILIVLFCIYLYIALI